MASYFLDTSALVKRYVQETGTQWIRRLLRRGNAELVYIARITLVELTSAIARRRQTTSLESTRASSILSRFRTHINSRYIVADMTPDLLAAAARLANTHALRAYDAVQLAAALRFDDRSRVAGLGGVTLICADRELNGAAQAEGLAVDDPNLHKAVGTIPDKIRRLKSCERNGFQRVVNTVWLQPEPSKIRPSGGMRRW